MIQNVLMVLRKPVAQFRLVSGLIWPYIGDPHLRCGQREVTSRPRPARADPQVCVSCDLPTEAGTLFCGSCAPTTKILNSIAVADTRNRAKGKVARRSADSADGFVQMESEFVLTVRCVQPGTWERDVGAVR
jgi:hypothetical protein